MTEQIRIVRIISRLNVGGPAQHAVLLAQYFHGLQWESLLLAGMEDETEKNMLHLVENTGVSFKRIHHMRRSIHLFRDALAFLQILRVLRRVRPHIVHTHTAKAGALGRVAALFTGVPVIVHTFHGHIFGGYFNSFRTRVFAWIERLLSKRTSVIVTLTEKLKMDLVELGIGGRKGIRVVPLGLNLERFRGVNRTGEFRKELGVRDQDVLFGVVGRLVPIKRHEVLLESLKWLGENGAHVHLAIIGGGEKEKELREQAQRLGITSRVHFCGFRDDLEQFYPDLDGAVLSSANEGTPVCLIEAMACGIPIIATRVGGIPDLLRDCRSCKLVDANDIRQFAQAMVEVMGEAQSLREFAQEHREVILQRYSVEQLGLRLESLYQELRGEL